MNTNRDYLIESKLNGTCQKDMLLPELWKANAKYYIVNGATGLKKIFFMGNSKADAVKNCPKDVNPEEWGWLIDKHWGTEKQKFRSHINKANRNKQKLKATQGSRSTARILEMLRKSRQSEASETNEMSQEASGAGNEPSGNGPTLQPEYLALWETTKRHKDHSMDEFAKEKLEEFNQLHQRQIEEFGVDNLTVEEAYMKVLGTSSGYIKGLGFGPKSPKRRKDGASYEENASFTQQMVDQFQHLERASVEREHKLNEKIQELQKDKAAMLEEMENMKKDAAERVERMRAEFLEMVKQQLQNHK